MVIASGSVIICRTQAEERPMAVATACTAESSTPPEPMLSRMVLQRSQYRAVAAARRDRNSAAFEFISLLMSPRVLAASLASASRSRMMVPPLAHPGNTVRIAASTFGSVTSQAMGSTMLMPMTSSSPPNRSVSHMGLRSTEVTASVVSSLLSIALAPYVRGRREASCESPSWAGCT